MAVADQAEKPPGASGRQAAEHEEEVKRDSVHQRDASHGIGLPQCHPYASWPIKPLADDRPQITGLPPLQYRRQSTVHSTIHHDLAAGVGFQLRPEGLRSTLVTAPVAHAWKY